MGESNSLRISKNTKKTNKINENILYQMKSENSFRTQTGNIRHTKEKFETINLKVRVKNFFIFIYIKFCKKDRIAIHISFFFKLYTSFM